MNGGPEGKHRYLRHISLGGNGPDTPIVRDLDDPHGSRLTLTFDGQVPALTGVQVKALLAPLISFDLKTPIQAFTDTLPPTLKDAILSHHVLVGMSTEMVLYAMGQPDVKGHELDGSMPFDEWVYGKPPKDVEFVRINGNRVIRVEIAKVGKPPGLYEGRSGGPHANRWLPARNRSQRGETRYPGGRYHEGFEYANSSASPDLDWPRRGGSRRQSGPRSNEAGYLPQAKARDTTGGQPRRRTGDAAARRAAAQHFQLVPNPRRLPHSRNLKPPASSNEA